MPSKLTPSEKVPALFTDYDPLKGRQFQILDSNGKVVSTVHEPKLSNEVLKQMYEDMIISKQVDLKALKLQRQGRMGTYASVRGQEAAQVGSCHALEKEDWVVPAFRESAAAHVRERENGLKKLFIY
ncbi:MAG: hypothetical protein GOV15_03950, partial [Candidatus Diapherotrites archaeon]|nr:hypothetical protein [Candidatus Diapherotrites archaeon]